MTVLADRVDGVIGVDTHRDTLTAAAVTALGGLLGELRLPLMRPATSGCWTLPAPGCLAAAALAVEGAGSYGAGPPRDREALRTGRPGRWSTA